MITTDKLEQQEAEKRQAAEQAEAARAERNENWFIAVVGVVVAVAIFVLLFWR